MNPPLWLPKEPEIEVRYDVGEREKYAENEPSCVYHNVRWKLRPVRPRASPDPGPENFKEIGGRSKHGEFPVVVVREHYRQLGYTVWGSDPRLVNPVTEEDEGYVAVSYSGYRERNHDAYRRMHKIFGAALLRLNEDADRAKMKRNAKMAPKKKTNRAGGDPDLFVFRPDDPSDRFFVEVKDKDKLNQNQLTCFPLIEKYLCPVKVARIVATKTQATEAMIGKATSR